MESQMEMGTEKSQDTREQMRETATQQRQRSEMLARQLSDEAMTHWQRSIEGLLALPTATALGVASTTLYLASFVARSFEVMQRSTEAIRAGMEESRRELRELRTSDEGELRREGGNRMRGDANRGGVLA